MQVHWHIRVSWILAVASAILSASYSFAQVPSDPLEQMEIAFVGSYSKDQIKARLDRAMDLYGLSKTKENYSRAGSALVALRKGIGPHEMDILDHMIRSHVKGVNIDFPKAAGLSAVFLAAGDR